MSGLVCNWDECQRPATWWQTILWDGNPTLHVYACDGHRNFDPLVRAREGGIVLPAGVQTVIQPFG